jgi:hypothetical protein
MEKFNADIISDKEYKNRLKYLHDTTSEIPLIKIDNEHNIVNSSVLMSKGPVVINNYCTSIGEENFFKILKSIYKNFGSSCSILTYDGFEKIARKIDETKYQKFYYDINHVDP